MANLSNINNKFIVTSETEALIGATSWAGVGSGTLAAGLVISGNTSQFILDNPSYNHFTMYSAGDSNIYNIFGSSGNYLIGTGNKDTSSWSEKMRIDSSGRVGIGITPFAWDSSFNNIQIGNKISLWNASNNGGLSFNQYYNGTNNIYQTNGTANRLQMDADGFHFYQASSGTAGNTATFAEKMRIDSSGNVGIGVTPEAWTGYAPVLQIGDRGAIAHYANDSLTIADNWYYDGTNRRIEAGFATRVQINSAAGSFRVENAGSDAADSAITFATRFLIDSSGITTLTAEGYQLAIVDTSSSNKSEILTSNNAMGFFADRANAIANSSMIFSIDNSTKMTIDSSGAITMNSGEYFSWGTTGATAIEGSTVSNKLAFFTQSTEKMRITSGARINMDVMAGQASEGVIRIGRYDANTSRYNEIQNSVTSTGAGSYMNLSVHSGTENVVTDVMTLLGNGNVSIGTINRVSKLTIGSVDSTANLNDGANNLRLETSSSSLATPDSVGAGVVFAQKYWSGSADLFRVGGIFGVKDASNGNYGGGLSFYTQPSFVTTDMVQRMRITSGGDVLINLTGPITSRYSTLIGTTLSNNYSWFASNDSLYVQRPNGTNGNAITFFRASVLTGSISLSGSATAYNTSSDYRLKENVVEMTGALDRVSQLKPSRFNFIADADKTVDGFLAHQVQEIVPEAITGEKDAMQDEEYEVSAAIYEDVIHPAIEEELDEDGNIITEAKEEWTESVLVSEAVKDTRQVPDYQGIDQSKLVPLLVAAIQELKAEIELLKSK